MRAVLVSSALALAGCAPLLTITHRDATHREVEVLLDRQPVGRTAPGQRLQVRVPRGAHELDLRDPQKGDNPWTDDGQPFELLIDGDVDVTLTTPAGPR